MSNIYKRIKDINLSFLSIFNKNHATLVREESVLIIGGNNNAVIHVPASWCETDNTKKRISSTRQTDKTAKNNVIVSSISSDDDDKNF
ncbi:MAG TPA: hypothetical protein PLV19_00890 [Nitrosomonas sp.]|nr:hypothetical protein [Nitrosomonas sp.]HQX12716.1 hypothetical protein [Nitrosomonas sp.]HRB20490.1 hypothetical protein [Nitrosomonas sp.]HRB32323.1 hypothetical protein [Nitrosomonas sp.]HRB44985.1 hypothetical protein [Nitrosomonas sp.]